MTSFDGRIASPARRLCRMNFKRRLLPLFLALGFVTLIYGVKLLISLAGIKLIINLTDSAPHGVYAVVPLNELKKGTFIVFPVPFSVRHELGVRAWLRDDVPLIKPVAALPGEKVCVSDAEVIVAGQKGGPVFSRDYLGLPLPRLRGCFSIRAGSVFPLSTFSDRSFDGRYLGPIHRGDIIGEAVPIILWSGSLSGWKPTSNSSGEPSS